MPSLGDVLSGLSYAADTPGALLRGGIGNLIDLFTGDDKQHGWRASSRDLLEQRGGFAPNEDGIDTGDVLGFAGDVILDPLNLVGGGLLAKMIGKGTRAKAANVARSRINLAADRGILTDTPVESAIGGLEDLLGHSKPRPYVDYGSGLTRRRPIQHVELEQIPNISRLAALLSGTNAAKYGDDIYDQFSN